MIKLIIFDQDGTLYNPNHNLTCALRRKTKEWISKKLKISMNEVEKIYDPLPLKYPNPLEGFSSIGLSPRSYLDNVFDKVDPREYLNKDKKLIRVFESIEQEKFIVTIASVKYSKSLQNSLGIHRFIKKTYSLGLLYPKMKNKYEVYEKIRRLNKLKKSEILVVGDNYPLDLKMAKIKGYNTVIVWNKHPGVGSKTIKDIYCLKGLIEKVG